MNTCTRLRSISLSAPELWHAEGITVPGNPHWRDLCLERAQSMASVLWSERTADWEPYWDASETDSVESFGYYAPLRVPESEHVTTLKKYLHMVQEAHLNFGSDDMNEDFDGISGDLDSLLTRHTCHLTYLSLSWSAFTLHNMYVFHGTSNLVTLSLDFGGIDHEWPWLPSLKHLHVCTQLWEVPVQHTTPLMEWPTCLPTLEILSIECGQYLKHENPEGTLEELEPVHLPLLRILRLKSTLYGLLELLRVLPLPNTGLDVYATYSHDPFESFEDADAYKTLIDHITRFWDTHGPRESSTRPVPLSASLRCAREYMFSPQLTQFILASVHPLSPWPLVLPRQAAGLTEIPPFCRFRGAHYADSIVRKGTYDAVTVLHLVGNGVGPDLEIGMHETPDLDISETLDRARIEDVVVEQATDIGYIQMLVGWLMQREAAGQPAPRLYVRDSGVEETRREWDRLASTVAGIAIVGDVYVLSRK